MRIPICYSKENRKDWILLELQGSFHLNEQPNTLQETVWNGLNIGELSVNWEQVGFMSMEKGSCILPVL